jgi:DNA polymerase III epsilon subunit-like protein
MRIIYFDLETTGYKGADKYSEKHKIIQIAMLENQHFFVSYINPEIPILDKSTKFHNITNAHVEKAPTFKKVWEQIDEQFGLSNSNEEIVLVAHNAFCFDRLILIKEMNHAGMVDIHKKLKNVFFGDSLLVFRHAIDEELKKEINKSTLEYSKFNLNNLHKFFFGIDIEDAHDALSDVLALQKICNCIQIDWSKFPYLIGVEHFKHSSWFFPPIYTNSSLISIKGIGKKRFELIKKKLGYHVETIDDFNKYFYPNPKKQVYTDDELVTIVLNIEGFLRKEINIIEDNVVLEFLSIVTETNPFFLLNLGFPFARDVYGKFNVKNIGFDGFVSIHKLIEQSFYDEKLRRNLQLDYINSKAFKYYTYRYI